MTSGRREELASAAGEVSPNRSPASQSRFHNFSFPTMNWGSQRILRCANPVSGIGGSATRSTTPDTRIEPQRDGNASFSTVNLLPMSPHAVGSKEKEAEQENTSSAAAEEAAAAAAMPWNLRKRRAACYVQSENGRNRYPCYSPSKPPLGKDDPGKAVMRRSVIGENGRRREFSVSLSREEIEEDFYAFKGTKPNRRPKKRPRAVQRLLDTLFPGLWLSEITKDTYKVDE